MNLTTDQIAFLGLIITFFGVIATFAAVCVAILQIKENAKIQRAIFLKDLYMQFHTDTEVSEAFYLIEYGNFKYEQDKFHGSKQEKSIDRLLTLIDIICEMYDQDFFSDREFKYFKYQIKRVMDNYEIQNYLSFLSDFCQGDIPKIFPSFERYRQKQSKH